MIERFDIAAAHNMADIENKINELVDAVNQQGVVIDKILEARNRITARVDELESKCFVMYMRQKEEQPRKSRAEECAERISHELRQSAVESRYAVVLPIIREYIKD